jgi:hypothetical protein
MAFLDQEFNVDTLPVGNGNFDPLPEGWYSSTISGAELKSTKAGDGEYIAIKYTITGPTHQGRVIFGNLNIKNPSTKAEEIGRQQLGEVMRAIGLNKVRDTDQLIGGQLVIKLSVKTGEYAGNEVKGYKAIGSQAGVAPASIMQSGSSPMGAPSSKAAPPWAKK